MGSYMSTPPAMDGTMKYEFEVIEKEELLEELDVDEFEVGEINVVELKQEELEVKELEVKELEVKLEEVAKAYEVKLEEVAEAYEVKQKDVEEAYEDAEMMEVPMPVATARSLCVGLKQKSEDAYKDEYKRQCVLIINSLNRSIADAGISRSVTLSLSACNLSISKMLVTDAKNCDIIRKLVTFIRDSYAGYNIYVCQPFGETTVTLCW